MRSAVDDVEQRHGQDVRVRTAEVAEQRQVGRVGGGLGDGQAHAEDRVRADASLVVGSVDLDQDLVDDALLARIDAFDRRAQLIDDGGDGLQDALAPVTGLVAVTQLVRLEGPGGRAGGDGRPLDDPVVEEHLHFDGRVSARIQDLARVDSLD